VEVDSFEEKLAVLHHVVGFSGSIACLYGGYGLISLGQLVSLMEISTLALNYRVMMVKEELSTGLGLINNIVFFLLFTVFRVFMLPFLVFKIYVSYGYAWEMLTASRKVCFAYAGLQLIILLLLNYYWYYGVLKMVARTLGFCKRPDNYKRVENKD